MSAFFDTNIVVYAVDPKSGLHHNLAEQLLAEHIVAHTAVLSSQVLQETYSVLTRKKQVAPDVALDVVRTLAHETIVPSDAQFVVEALALGQRYQLSVWDGLIVQAALQARCDVLYTEDLQAGMRFGGLQVVNPFGGAVQEPVKGYVARPRKVAAKTKR